MISWNAPTYAGLEAENCVECDGRFMHCVSENDIRWEEEGGRRVRSPALHKITDNVCLLLRALAMKPFLDSIIPVNLLASLYSQFILQEVQNPPMYLRAAEAVFHYSSTFLFGVYIFDVRVERITWYVT